MANEIARDKSRGILSVNQFSGQTWEIWIGEAVLLGGLDSHFLTIGPGDEDLAGSDSTDGSGVGQGDQVCL